MGEFADHEKLYWEKEKHTVLGRKVKGLVEVMKMDHENETVLDYDDHFELVIRRKRNAPQEKRQGLRRQEHQRADQSKQVAGQEAVA